MSEIQRFEFSNGNFGFTDRIASDSGRYVTYADLLWYRRKWFEQIVLTTILAVGCALLSTLLVYEKASHGPVVMPMGAGEKAELLQEVHAAKVAKEQAQADLRKARADYAASQAFFANRAKELEGKIAKDVQSLESPQARVAKINEISQDMAKSLSTHQGVVLEAKRVLGVKVQVME